MQEKGHEPRQLCPLGDRGRVPSAVPNQQLSGPVAFFVGR